MVDKFPLSEFWRKQCYNEKFDNNTNIWNNIKYLVITNLITLLGLVLLTMKL